MRIGVLSLQGGVEEHLKSLRALDVEAIEVKYEKDIAAIDGIILPGGESTTIGKLLRRENLLEPLKERIKAGMPAYGTCAGMILLAKNIENDDHRHLELMDITVRRNAYGTQINSFSGETLIEEVSMKPIPLVFIRAPYISGVGADTKILHQLDGHIVAARQKNLLVTSFHPELTKDLEFHRYFIKMCTEAKNS